MGAKIYNLILIVFLSVFVSCGSRTTQTKQKTEVSQETTLQVQTSQEETHEKKEETHEKQSVQVQEVEQKTEKQSTENINKQNTKTKKKKTYYPNGQTKSETEETETESETIQKQALKIDYLQSTVLALMEERDSLKANLIKSEEEKLEYFHDYANELIEKDKATERADILSFILPIVLVVLGFSLWALWKNRKNHERD